MFGNNYMFLLLYIGEYYSADNAL